MFYLNLEALRCPDVMLRVRRAIRAFEAESTAYQLVIDSIEPSLERDLRAYINNEHDHLAFSSSSRPLIDVDVTDWDTSFDELKNIDVQRRFVIRKVKIGEDMNLKFSRTQHEDHLFIDVEAKGLLIGMTGGWSVGIPPQDAIGLIKNGKSSKFELIDEGDRFLLAHGDAILMLSANEVEQMHNLITKAPWYG